MSGKPWFAQKSYGYGAGLPIAWEGWATLIGAIAAMVIVNVVFMGLIGFVATIALVVALVLIAAAKTEGDGWRWRWGE